MFLVRSGRGVDCLEGFDHPLPQPSYIHHSRATYSYLAFLPRQIPQCRSQVYSSHDIAASAWLQIVFTGNELPFILAPLRRCGSTVTWRQHWCERAKVIAKKTFNRGLPLHPRRETRRSECASSVTSATASRALCTLGGVCPHSEAIQQAHAPWITVEPSKSGNTASTTHFGKVTCPSIGNGQVASGGAARPVAPLARTSD